MVIHHINRLPTLRDSCGICGGFGAQGSEKDSLKSSKSFDISASRAGFEPVLPPRKGERSSRFEASPGLPLLPKGAREMG